MLSYLGRLYGRYILFIFRCSYLSDAPWEGRDLQNDGVRRQQNDDIRAPQVKRRRIDNVSAQYAPIRPNGTTCNALQPYKSCPTRDDVHGSWSLTTVMAARAFFLPGIVLLFCAFILSLLVAVSLPNLPTLDIVRCHFTGGTTPRVSMDPESIEQIRVNLY